MHECDIAIVGGGLTGVAAAHICAELGYSTIHFAPKGPSDKRTSALMHPSVQFLEQSGLVEPDVDFAEALTKIRIIDATQRLFRAPEALFDATEVNLAAFGWNFTNADLLTHMALRAASLTSLNVIEEPVALIERTSEGFYLKSVGGTEFKARLVVGADGKNSKVRSFSGISTRTLNFEQSALVCDLELERPLDGQSVEFHYENGPFTLVPAGGRKANLVWMDLDDVLQNISQYPVEKIQTALAEKSQHLFGSIRLLTNTTVFPLSTLRVSEAGRDGIILIGEAAHAFPPIGAQGLNLGLRDVSDLSDSLKKHAEARAAAWALDVSKDYAQARSADLLRTGSVVDTLFKSLISEFLPTHSARSAGLWGLKLLPGLRKTAFNIGMGIQKSDGR